MRDYTRYDLTLQGRRLANLAKNRAIFETVRHPVHHGVSPQSITDALPDTRSRWVSVPGRIDDSASFMAGARRFDAGRFFVASEELLHYHDRTYVSSNQWGQNTEAILSALARAFPSADISFLRAGEAASISILFQLLERHLE
jgi:hypothetical protein